MKHIHEIFFDPYSIILRTLLNFWSGFNMEVRSFKDAYEWNSPMLWFCSIFSTFILLLFATYLFFILFRRFLFQFAHLLLYALQHRVRANGSLDCAFRRLGNASLHFCWHFFPTMIIIIICALRVVQKTPRRQLLQRMDPSTSANPSHRRVQHSPSLSAEHRLAYA